MSFTYDPSTSLGRVRMLCTDRDETNPIFQDAEIEAFLGIEGNSVRLAAALALETIASDQVLVLKVVKTLDTQTDGAKVSDALLKRAAGLREAENNDPSGSFDIAENVYDNFSRRERWLKYAQRSLT
jgi:hypothetical protein